MSALLKVLVVFGTRPEAIKMALVVKALSESHFLEVKVCVTAQHRQMLDQVLELFDIRPDFDLNLMTPNQQLADTTANVLLAMQGVYREWRPDLVLVQGDTTTAFAASLAAFYEKIAVGHVEAGLRTGNMESPWPEEANRRLTALLTNYHFAPTEGARQNLLLEGVNPAAVVVTGNTVIDALRQMTAQFCVEKDAAARFEASFSYLDPNRRLVLVTGHRRENFGQGFKNICLALTQVAQRGDVELVYPVHLNPNVRVPVQRILGRTKNVHLIEPLDYAPFSYLLNRCFFIITDSGGIQEEATYLGKPVLVMRDTTERPEAVESGNSRLVGTDIEKIVDQACLLLDDAQTYRKMAVRRDIYGDGCAAQRIVKYLEALKGVQVEANVS
jgi:UDP-N-acetylglucosamine 2-epimerase (non-hydrolysing)